MGSVKSRSEGKLKGKDETQADVYCGARTPKDSYLHVAAKNGDYSKVCAILEANEYRKFVNSPDEDKLCPLHYAVRHDHLAVVELLVTEGADVNKKSELDVTPLHIAAKYNGYNKECSRVGGVEVAGNEQNAEAAKPDSSIISYLLSKHAKVNAKDKYDSTPLHFSAMRGNTAAVHELLKAKKTKLQARDKQMMTPLHVACMYKHCDVVKILLDYGADATTEDAEKRTPLHLACAVGSNDICKALLEKIEKSTNAKTKDKVHSSIWCQKDNRGSTVLHHAVDGGNIMCVQMTLDKVKDLEKGSSDIIASTLSVASKHTGNEDVVRLLVNNLNKGDIKNQRAIHIAAERNHKDIIQMLKQGGANIEIMNNNTQTALMIAAKFGCIETLEYLLEVGDVDCIKKKDVNEKTALFLTAENNRVEAAQILLRWEKDNPETDHVNMETCHLDESKEPTNGGKTRPKAKKRQPWQRLSAHVLGKKDDELSEETVKNPPNTTKGVSCAILQLLLTEGANYEAINFEENKPIHLAAGRGKVEIVRELIKADRHKSLVMSQNDGMNTPLHLAALGGHAKTVELLLEEKADIIARNATMWTPLHCAASRGHTETVKLLLDKGASVDTTDKAKTTPLHQAAKNGQREIVQILLENKSDITRRDIAGNNCLDHAIDNNHEEVAMAIIEDANWKKAMHNVTKNEDTHEYNNTPMRKLIRKMPDVAKVVLNKCMAENKKDRMDPNYSITFDFSLLDDSFCVLKEQKAIDLDDSNYVNPFAVYEEDGFLKSDTEPYTRDASALKKNHPLTLIVKHERVNLIGHPIVMSLIRQKWNSYGKLTYFLGLFMYIIFVLFLTGYVLFTPPPYYYRYDHNGTRVWFANGAYKFNQKTDTYMQPTFLAFCKWGVITLTTINLLKEISQIAIRRRDYINPENIMEWVLFILSVLFVADSPTDDEAGLKEPWQWCVGTFAIFLAWMNLIIFVRKLAKIGIYVVMFIDILKTFCRFSIILLLFLISFGLSFYILLMNQPTFSSIGFALMKTFVMMTGEFDYDATFRTINYLSRGESNKTGDKYFGEVIWYRDVTYVMFSIFLVIASVLIMNLLVGLAIDDINGVQEQAKLKKHALQVELALDVEQMIPTCFRRKQCNAITTIYPNSKEKSSTGTAFQDMFSVGSTISVQAIAKSLNPEKPPIEKLQISQDNLLQRVKNIEVLVQPKGEKSEFECRGKGDPHIGESMTETRHNFLERLKKLERRIEEMYERQNIANENILTVLNQGFNMQDATV
ncbi:transient receptor potential cation channel subfamily A member 1 homolog [Glandiceps talaboti]